MNSLYLIVNIASFIVPFIFSFHPKLAFYKKWKFIWPSIFLSAIPFVAWDVYFTHLGIWGFNPDYLSGSGIFHLPYEEVLFFICIPYACLFTYHCLGILIEKDLFGPYVNSITAMVLVVLTLLAVIFSDRLYTVVTFALLVLLLALIQGVVKPVWLSRFYFSYLILLVPFTLVNGVLTGTGIQEPIVWYNTNEIMGIRFLTIPVEDIFYGMLLILLNVLIYETLKRTNSKSMYVI